MLSTSHMGEGHSLCVVLSSALQQQAGMSSGVCVPGARFRTPSRVPVPDPGPVPDGGAHDQALCPHRGGDGPARTDGPDQQGPKKIYIIKEDKLRNLGVVNLPAHRFRLLPLSLRVMIDIEGPLS